MEKSKKMHMIGNAHIDPVWLWQWQEGFQEIKATFRSALDRMKEFDDFVFTCSAASYYAWIEENEPEMFEEIRKRVAQGRWILAGGWWIQPDCNAIGGESFARQGLYAQRYFREKFGKQAQFGYNVDSFGHQGMLPQFLKKQGMTGYVFMRPGRHEKHLEGETFLWQSADGSQVAAYRIPFEYCTWPDQICAHVERCASLLKEPDGRMMSFYGVGNHGGAPTVKNIESIHEMNRRGDLPELVMSSPDRYFAEVAASGKRLPTVYGELFHHSSGCYSADMRIKAANRRAEISLMNAEKLSVLADALTDYPYPQAALTDGWKTALFNQFHDIMAGTSLKSASEDALREYGHAAYLADHATNSAMQRLTWRIDIPREDGMRPLIVMNPNGFACKAAVEVEMPTPKPNMVLLDPEDYVVAYQLIQSEAASLGRSRMVFVAELPALGYRTYRLALREAEAATLEPTEDTQAENPWLRLVVNPETGYVTALENKADGAQYFRAPGAVPVVIEDDSDTWSHGVYVFDKQIGAFQANRVYCLEDGPVRKVIRAVYTYGKSVITQDFCVYRELEYVPVRVKVDWHEKRKMLKLSFPLQLNYLRASYGIPYGVSFREPNGQEFPFTGFMDFEGTNPGMETAVTGLSVLCDTRTACSTMNQEARLTVLRSPIFAHHVPYEPDDRLSYTYMDQGESEFTYALYPHSGSWEQSRAAQLCELVGNAPIALFETYHSGPLPQTACFAEVDAPSVLLCAMKQAEDGSGDVILRLRETSGLEADSRVRLCFWNVESVLHFAPWEIKTIRVTKADHRFLEANILEDVYVE